MTPAISWAVRMRAILMFHKLWGTKSQDSAHRPQFWKRKESRSRFEPRSLCLPAYRLTAGPNRLTATASSLTVHPVSHATQNTRALKQGRKLHVKAHNVPFDKLLPFPQILADGSSLRSMPPLLCLAWDRGWVVVRPFFIVPQYLRQQTHCSGSML